MGEYLERGGLVVASGGGDGGKRTDDGGEGDYCLMPGMKETGKGLEERREVIWRRAAWS